MPSEHQEGMFCSRILASIVCMNFIHAETADNGGHELATKIAAVLGRSEKVLWLVPGGSNISTAVDIMEIVRERATIGELGNLSVSLTDERFGPVGHADSNWEQLIDAGFDFDNITAIPVLRGASFEATVAEWGKEMLAAFEANPNRIGHFGIGADGHIAGILPHSPAVSAEIPTYGYEAGKFKRITLTAILLQALTSAYGFAFGASKSKAIHELRDSNLSLDDEPAQLLKAIPEAYLYSDCV